MTKRGMTYDESRRGNKAYAGQQPQAVKDIKEGSDPGNRSDDKNVNSIANLEKQAMIQRWELCRREVSAAIQAVHERSWRVMK